MKNLCLHNVSINRNFYHNLFIKEYAKMKKAKSLGFTEFLVRYRIIGYSQIVKERKISFIREKC